VQLRRLPLGHAVSAGPGLGARPAGTLTTGHLARALPSSAAQRLGAGKVGQTVGRFGSAGPGSTGIALRFHSGEQLTLRPCAGGRCDALPRTHVLHTRSRRTMVGWIRTERTRSSTVTPTTSCDAPGIAAGHRRCRPPTSQTDHRKRSAPKETANRRTRGDARPLYTRSWSPTRGPASTPPVNTIKGRSSRLLRVELCV
jgi:hypothetical protein